MSETTPATRNPNPCVALLQNREAALAELVGKEHIARFMAATLSTLRKDSKLALCTRESFYAAAHQAALLKLQPGILGEVYLVPYGKTATLIIGYKGYIVLAGRHPDIKRCDGRPIYEGEDFEFDEVSGYLHHKRDWQAKREDKDLIGAWAAAWRHDDPPDHPSYQWVMNREEIEKVSKGGNIWRDNMPAMFRKTAIRTLFQRGSVPRSIDMTQALEYEAEEERKAEVLSVRDERLDEEPPPVDMEEGFDDEDAARKEDKDYHDDLGFEDPERGSDG